MRLANQLSRERGQRGWSQGKVAAGIGISRQSYAAIEAGSAVPSTEIALRLARLFARSVEEIFSLPDAPVERVSARWIGSRESPIRRNPIRKLPVDVAVPPPLSAFQPSGM